MARRLAVVLSQSPSQNPKKRQLEEDIVTTLLLESGIDVTIIPNLYHLTEDGTGMVALRQIQGEVVVLSWLFPRAARWTLDRNGFRGQEGIVLLTADLDEEEEDQPEEEPDEKNRVLSHDDLPKRKIYCLDLRVSENPNDYIDEIKRIYGELTTTVVSLGGFPEGAPSAPSDSVVSDTSENNNSSPSGGGLPIPDFFGFSSEDKGDQANSTPLNGLMNGESTNGHHLNDSHKNDLTEREPDRIDESSARRWYPVIDFSRCTNCMECIDFCLFGVYGVDPAETILVEQPDNCRKGCPACSRVCPENAIIFPLHKTPAIAGSPEVGASLKIDLSKLFGAPNEEKSAAELAALERDEQLVEAGRKPVGLDKKEPTAQTTKGSQNGKEKDRFDHLLEELDEFDL
ncbi:MAG: ferredoxin family protein [Pirellulaceae bacterium]|nr:ferredoxin family protein [Pirellulaceae bacterium]